MLIQKIFMLTVCLLFLTGCDGKSGSLQERQNNCISDDCFLERCFENNQSSCETLEGELGDLIDKTNRLNEKYSAYDCEWGVNNTSNLAIIDCRKK